MKVWNILRAVRSIFHCCEIEKKKKEMIRYTSLNQKVKRKKEEKKTFRCLTSETSEINFL